MRSAESQTTVRSILTLDTHTINNAYLFTIKHTSRYPSEKQYLKVLKKWEKKLSFYPQFIAWELDSIGKLHVHGIALARPNYLTKRLNKKTYSVHVQQIDSDIDFKNWYNYITKEPQNCNPYILDEFLSDYEIRHHPYPFLKTKTGGSGDPKSPA